MNNVVSPILAADFYKLSHRRMYPNGTQYVYSTWTPRGNRIKGAEYGNVAFGLQAFIKGYLIDFFNEGFFKRDKNEVIDEYIRIIKNTIGGEIETSHLEALHDLGYLPLSIKALPEGTISPFRCPQITIVNTHPDFFWLTNYIETLMSCELWQPSTAATIANIYRKLLDTAAMKTVGDTEFVQFQGHDFSMRGMPSLESATLSGMAHLLSFSGSDSICGIQGLEKWYGADVTKELVGTSIPATEHSVQCSYNDDLAYIENIITKVHPEGFCSVVSDGFDFWKVMTVIAPQLKDKIMARNGRIVFRPDSGDPELIIAGDPDSSTEWERKGAVEILWETFRGKVNEKGYKVLDEHVGLIYGDAITIERAKIITDRLEAKGFASSNIVFGVGSFSYQYLTRDSQGFALKSTAVVIDGAFTPIFKDPKTGDGIKKSQKGRVAVFQDGDSYRWIDGLNFDDKVPNDQLKEVFRNGELLIEQSLAEIRARLASAREKMPVPKI